MGQLEGGGGHGSFWGEGIPACSPGLGIAAWNNSRTFILTSRLSFLIVSAELVIFRQAIKLNSVPRKMNLRNAVARLSFSSMIQSKDQSNQQNNQEHEEQQQKHPRGGFSPLEHFPSLGGHSLPAVHGARQAVFVGTSQRIGRQSRTSFFVLRSYTPTRPCMPPTSILPD